MKLVQPETVDEAINALGDHEMDAKIVAGGTALVLMMQQKLIEPELLVALQRIPGLDGVTRNNGRVRIGSNTHLRDLAEDSTVREQYPSLSRACASVANIRIRNAATIGGNLAEADYASDPPAVLAALDASVIVAGPEGEREIAITDLITGFYTTCLEPTEIITAIELPEPESADRADVYFKYLSRSSEDRPCLGVAARGDFVSGSEDELTELRVVVGAASAVPQRVPEVEATAAGQQLSEALIAEIADAYADAIEPIDDQRGSAWYRKRMVKVFATRALEALRDSRGSARARGQGD